MIELKFRLLLIGFGWACVSEWVQCSRSNFNPLEECKKQCRDFITPTENPTEVNSQSSELSSCVKKCLLLAEGNANATTRSTSVPVTTPTTTDRPKFECPTEYGPNPGEIIPGDVSDFDVEFVKKNKENSQDWVVHLNWTTPKAVNTSSKWRGYLVIWFSEDSTAESEHGGDLRTAKCISLPKNQAHLDINETDGWKYPDGIYITVVALPSDKDSHQMYGYFPKRDWKYPDKYVPIATLKKGHAIFRLSSTARIILLIVAGILLGFGLMCMLHVWSSKRKGFEACKVTFPVEKMAGKNADEMKDQLIASKSAGKNADEMKDLLIV